MSKDLCLCLVCVEVSKGRVCGSPLLVVAALLASLKHPAHDVMQVTVSHVDRLTDAALSLSHRQGKQPKGQTKDRREAGKALDPNDLECELNDVEGVACTTRRGWHPRQDFHRPDASAQGSRPPRCILQSRATVVRNDRGR